MLSARISARFSCSSATPLTLVRRGMGLYVSGLSAFALAGIVVSHAYATTKRYDFRAIKQSGDFVTKSYVCFLRIYPVPHFKPLREASRMGRSATRSGCGIMSAGMDGGGSVHNRLNISLASPRLVNVSKSSFRSGMMNWGLALGASGPGLIGTTTAPSFFTNWAQRITAHNAWF